MQMKFNYNVLQSHARLRVSGVKSPNRIRWRSILSSFETIGAIFHYNLLI